MELESQVESCLSLNLISTEGQIGSRIQGIFSVVHVSKGMF